MESTLDFEFLQSLTCHTKPLGEVSYQLKARSANLESVVGGLGDYKGDKGSDFAIQAPLSPLEKNKKGNLLDFSMIEYLTTLLESLPTPPKEGWDKISLNDKTYLSLNPSKKEIANIDENVLVSFVEMAAVSDNGFIQNKVDKSLKELKNGGYTYFKENDILIAKITPCMENGKCAIAKNLTNGLGLGSTEFHIFRAKEGLNNKFLFLCLNQDAIRTEAAKNMTGASGHRRVPIGFYESLQIPLPPLKSQQQIVNVIENIESHIVHLDSIFPFLESKKQEILKEFLMQ